MTSGSDNKKVTVIIPNYNGERFLSECFSALEKQDANYDVIVVDNGSTDGSAGWLKERNIKAIILEDNRGFSAAVNEGIKNSNTPYVILLNNDAYVCPGFISELVSAIEQSDKIFAVSSMMIMNAKRTHADSAGDGMTILGWAYQRGTDEPLERYSEQCPVFSACAGAAIYRRDAFEKIGYFDEMHFAYLEDIDVSWRAKLAGYENRYCPGAQCFHVGSGTSGSKYNSFKVRLSARNNIFLHYKNQPFLQLCINFIPLLIGVIIKGFFFLKIGFLKDYLSGVGEGLKNCGQCRKAPRAAGGFGTYLSIEGEMLTGIAEYTASFIYRKLNRHKTEQ